MNARSEEKNAYAFRMPEVYNFNTDKIEQADFWTSKSEEELFILRTNLRKGIKNYGCPVCKTSVLLLRSTKDNWFFRHRKREEGVECVIVDENMPEEKKKIQRYNATVETDEHKKLKKFIHRFLETDPNVVGKPLVEKRVKGQKISTAWKRPDVQCHYKNWHFVFEVQISNTWLSDIVARDMFYEAEGKVILWVFNSFDSCKPSEETTKADIFYNNPEVNLFVLDEAARHASQKAGKLILACYYRIPKVNYQTETIDKEWHHQLVSLDELIIDPHTLKPYFVSYRDKYREATKALKQWKSDQLQAAIEREEQERYERLQKQRLIAAEQKRLKEEQAAIQAEAEAQRKEQARIRKLEQERADRQRRAEYELARQARLKAEQEQRETHIAELISINNNYEYDELSDLSVEDLKLIIEREKEIILEQEKVLAIRKERTALYYQFKKIAKLELSKGQLVGEDGSMIANRKMMDYCMDLLASLKPSINITQEQLITFGYAVAREFGQTGTDYFIKIGAFSNTPDRWKLVSLYKHCMRVADENPIAIQDLWQFCFSVKTPDWLLDEENIRVA